MKMLLLSSVLVLGLTACSHKGHHKCAGECSPAQKSACAEKECGLKKGNCADCQKKDEATTAK